METGRSLKDFGNPNYEAIRMPSVTVYFEATRPDVGPLHRTDSVFSNRIMSLKEAG
jgi:hypothetical protein